MMTLTLDELPTDCFAIVSALDLDFAVRERLGALGLRIGRSLHVVRRIGVSGPLQVRIGHTDLILRNADASRIRVELPSTAAP